MQRFLKEVVLLPVVGLALVLPSAHATGWKLPAWGGQLHGQLLVMGDDGPRVAWTLTPGSPSEGVRTLSFDVENETTRLRVSATFDARTGDGSWRVEEGRVDIGPWVTAFGAVLGREWTGISGVGTVVITGDGRVHHGRAEGLLSLSVDQATVRDEGQGWSLEGISLNAGVDLAALPGVRVPVSLGVRTITTARFGARNFSVDGVLAGGREFFVKSARIEIAGGEVTADPFTVRLSPPALAVKLHMAKVGLQDIVALVPTVLSDARGRVSGGLGLSWSQADGLQFGDGSLAVDDIEPATLRLAPRPGFLSSHVGPRLVIIPGLPEPLSRWFSSVNPAYESLTEIELGKMPLRVQSLKIRLSPEGDENRHSASVQVVALPDKAGSAVDRVVFTINVAGPLSQVLHFGMNDHLSFGGHP